MVCIPNTDEGDGGPTDGEPTELVPADREPSVLAWGLACPLASEIHDRVRATDRVVCTPLTPLVVDTPLDGSLCCCWTTPPGWLVPALPTL
jgi:hypothetical protein